jgi:Nuclease-related domain
MADLTPLETPAIASALAALLLIAALLIFWRWYRRRRAQAALLAAVTGGAYDFMRDVLLPDTQGIRVHFDFLLLTARGIVVVDLRDIHGNVFGGDQMTEWTVMNGSNRYTFVNPQAALYDRIASVRALATESPTEGRIVFGNGSRFPKGLPSHTRMLESLASDFPAIDRQTVGALPEQWMAEWSVLRAATTPSMLMEPKAAI